jgi:hypothetical protein
VLGLRFVLGLHAVFYLATAAVLASIVRGALAGAGAEHRRFAGWLTAFLYLASFSAFMNHFNGLETGFVLFLHACAWRFFAAKPLASLGRHVAFGALLGLCVLGRIDGVFLVIGASVLVAMRPARGSESHPVPPRRLARFAAVSATAFLVSLPWWSFNLWLTGDLMPSSGTAQQILLSELAEARLERRLWFAVTEPLELMVPWYNLAIVAPVTDRLGVPSLGQLGLTDGFLQPVIAVRAALALAAGAIGAALLVRGRAARTGPLAGSADDRPRRTLAFGALLFAFALSLVVYYAWTSFAVHHYWRYFSSLMPVFTVATALTLAALGSRMRAATALVVLVCLPPVPISAVVAHTDRITLERYKGRRNAYYRQQVALVERAVPEGETVASRNSGTFGFFRDHVVNLDGKVNPTALEYEGELWRYLDDEGIDWFVDWPDHVEITFGENPGARGWEQVDREGGFRLYRRVPDGPVERGGP